jgi:hypothetical protein
MKTINNFIALSFLLFCSFTLSMNIRSKFKTRGQECFIPDPNSYRFNDNWRLYNGGGEITFQGRGRDVYVQLNNEQNSAPQYWIVINGWDNTKSRVTRQSDSDVVCFSDVAPLDLYNLHDYKLVLDPQTATIAVYIDGQLHFSCTDPQGWNARGAQWYSISKWCCADFEFCNLESKPIETCFTPDPNAYKFNNDWTLGENGSGDLVFKGTGRDVYIQLNNQMDSSSHQYWIVSNGWSNTMSRVTRGDGSTVCEVPVAAVDLNTQNDYRVTFNPLSATIKMFINGRESFSCQDPNGWNASGAKYYSVSRYADAAFEFCNVKSEPLSDNSCFLPDPNAQRFDEAWTLQNGGGELSFKGKGRDVYIRAHNGNNAQPEQYWIVINGWDNTSSRITRSSDQSLVCQVGVPALNLNVWHDYKVIFNNLRSKITVIIDGQESFSCTDDQGWNAPNATHLSISRWGGADFVFCNVETKPYTDPNCFLPDPNTHHFNDAWTLQNGGGEINFSGKGRDVYVRFHDGNGAEPERYWIVINGWDNTSSRITRENDSSVVCQVAVPAVDLNVIHKYRIVSNPIRSSITVFIDGQESFSCTDSQGWNAPNATHFSISRWGGVDFTICDINSQSYTDPNCFLPDPNTHHFNDAWTLQNGNGEITFKGKGRDVYVRFHDGNGAEPERYWIVINGWDNTSSRITRSSDQSLVCQVAVPALDLNVVHDYRIVSNSIRSSITVFIDGQQSFSCTDDQGWNASNASHFSISRWGGVDFTICDINSQSYTDPNCFLPDPNTHHFNDAWALQNGGGEITFKGKGRDVYIRFHNGNGAEPERYWIVINGWDNTSSRITRENDSSLVCQVAVPALNLNVVHDYRIVSNPARSSITVFIDGQQSFSCTDDQGWNASNATHFSISRWGGVDFTICDINSTPYSDPNCWNSDPSSYKFQDNWTLKNGAGEITWRGLGRDAYIQLNNQMDSSSHQYWIISNGWDNTMSRVTRGDGSTVCEVPVTAIDLNRYHDYKLVLDKSKHSITLSIDGQSSFSCTDTQGWNANGATHFSLTHWGGVTYAYCDVNVSGPHSDCWTPNDAEYKFQDNWTLNNGAGEIHFTGTGRDVYIQLNNAQHSATQYWVVIAGWNNTKSRVTRSSDSEVVCFPDTPALDLNVPHDYRVIFNPSAAQIKVIVDGQDYFSCNDWQGWNAPNASFFSISRWGGTTFEICDVEAHGLNVPQSYLIKGDFINATTGKKIVNLDSAVLTIADSAGHVFPANVNGPSSSYKAYVPAGHYDMTASATGFITGEHTSDISADSQHDIFLSPIVKDLTARVVLKWKLVTPGRALDLDLYALNKKNGDRVYYLAKKSKTGQLILDVDNVKNGPETVTIAEATKDKVQIFVRNYNKIKTLAESGAEVAIYRGNQQIASLQVPTGDNDAAKTTWDIGNYNGATGEFELTNKLIVA